MNRRDQYRRDTQIAVDRATGSSEERVASRYGVSVRTVRRVSRKWKAGAFVLEKLDPVEAISDQLARLDQAASDLASLRTSATDGATRIRAIQTQVDIWEIKFRLLMDTGVVPRVPNNFLAFRKQLAAQLTRWITGAIRRDGLSPELEEWLQTAIADWVKNGPTDLAEEK